MSEADTPPTHTVSADDYLSSAAQPSGGGSSASGAGRASRSSRSSAPPPEEPAPEVKKLTPKFRVLREGVSDIYTGVQMATFFVDPFAAKLIELQKDACVDAWIDLAVKDKRVADWLTRLTTGSAWSAVIMAHLSIAIPILARKGIIPGGAIFNPDGLAGMPTAEPIVPEPPVDAPIADTVTFGPEPSPDGFDNPNGQTPPVTIP